MSNTLRLAIVGCGTVAQRCHFPAARSDPRCQIEWLVDRDLANAQNLARQLRGATATTDYSDIIGHVDAAILAVPHSLHAPLGTELLRHGIHLLVEKPMAISIAECDDMIEAAEDTSAVLAVGLMRRFLHSARFARWVVQTNILGPIESFDFREGNIYNWPVQSASFFRRETAGGGVLLDTGAHTLDLLLWWLGDVHHLEYYNDSYGGVEADCKLRLSMASGAQGVVELSRSRNLRNTAIIRGPHAELEVALRTNEAVLRSRQGRPGLSGMGIESTEVAPVKQSFFDLFSLQMKDWTDAILEGHPPRVSGTEGRRSVALIEACYRQRRLLELPWMQGPDQGVAI